MHKQVSIGKLKPNPFRHLEDYPIDKAKLEELERSFDQTGFWDNILARQNGSGFEIAYGHHRLTALRRKFGNRKKVGVIVRPLSDEDMIKIMAAENAEEYRTLAAVEQETIRAVVQALADGRITIPPPPARSPFVYYAPSFIPGERLGDDRPPVPYTRESIAKFLGWTTTEKDKARNKTRIVPSESCTCAFRALEAIERGVMKRSDFEGLTRVQADQSVTQAMAQFAAHQKQAAKLDKAASTHEKAGDTRKAERLKRQAEQERKAATRDAKNIATTLKKGFTTKDKNKQIGVRDAEKEARRVSTPTITPKEVVPDVQRISERFAKRVMEFLSEDKAADEITLLVKFRDEMSSKDRKLVASQLDKLRVRCENFYYAITGED